MLKDLISEKRDTIESEQSGLLLRAGASLVGRGSAARSGPVGVAASVVWAAALVAARALAP